MDLERVIGLILPLIGLLSPFVALFLGYIQARDRRPREKADTNKSIAETWQILTNELQEEIDRYKDERSSLLDGVAKLETRLKQLEDERSNDRVQFNEERKQWLIEKTSLMETINNLRDEVNRLQAQVNGVKKTTDELRSQKRNP